MYVTHSELVALQRWESDGGAVPLQRIVPNIDFIHSAARADSVTRPDE
jgi:hypothetical protein